LAEKWGQEDGFFGRKGTQGFAELEQKTEEFGKCYRSGPSLNAVREFNTAKAGRTGRRDE
jgi:hypothetical protein